jgi:hypothetical protein
LDDVCPRPILAPDGVVSRPIGSFRERGCGASLGHKTLGGQVIVDVVGSGAM